MGCGLGGWERNEKEVSDTVRDNEDGKGSIKFLLKTPPSPSPTKNPSSLHYTTTDSWVGERAGNDDFK